MKKWTVQLTGKAFKQFRKLPESIQDIADEVINDLQREGPNPKYWDVKKVGNEGYRVRLNYRYRMRYLYQSKRLMIEIFYVGHRKDAYK